jgi:hypothetical protein
MADIPVLAVTVTEDIAADLRDEDLKCPVVPIHRIVKPPFAQNLERRTTGPLFVVN